MRVRLEQVTKKFQNKKKEMVSAVNNLNIDIQSGKLIGLLGPSGCGKSTTLFMIAGIHTLSEGKIYFDDRDMTQLPPEKRGVGLVFQNYALYPHLTVWDNISFPLVNSKEMKKRLKDTLAATNLEEGTKVSFKEYIDKLVHEAAGLVDITAYLDRKPAELSGGQQQRVAIARAIVKNPSILLMDEPLSNLDARLRIQTRDEIKRIQKRTGITTIFVTHDQEEALNISDEVIIMKNGIFQQQGAPQDVYDNPANQFVAEFLGSPPINIVNGHIVGNKLFIGDEEWCSLPTALSDQKVHIGMRAEHIKIAKDRDSSTFSAKVITAARLGGSSTIEAELLDGQRITMHYDMDGIVQENDVFKLMVRPQTICIFNETGEKLLQC